MTASEMRADPGRLRCLRVASESSQRDLAAILKAEPVSVRRWEQGREAVPPLTARRLTVLFGCSADHLARLDTKRLEEA